MTERRQGGLAPRSLEGSAMRITMCASPREPSSLIFQHDRLLTPRAHALFLGVQQGSEGIRSRRISTRRSRCLI